MIAFPAPNSLSRSPQEFYDVGDLQAGAAQLERPIFVHKGSLVPWIEAWLSLADFYVKLVQLSQRT